ncbi:MAG: FKBP-type peptidyl-prolyl cis-trans isomerase [Parcubacteria group bacterium]|nr:FKBP-type peptidyl-prolyl cis-trans isomerase [Parcubacteria group bacterium]
MNKTYLILFIVIILVVIFVVQKFSSQSLSGYSAQSTTEQINTTSTQATSTTATSSKKVEEPKLIKEDLVVGTGKEIYLWNTAVVNYRGVLADGVQFDSSYERGQPFSFVLGAGEVIKGWDEGVLGMKVGGKRKLIIPPSLAYGDRGVPKVIPPKATLVFEIELLGIK